MNSMNEPRLKKDGLAVLLIDMQKNFIFKIPYFRRKKIILEQINIIKICTEYNIPLFVIEMKELDEETIDILKKEIDEVPVVIKITKNYPSAFKKTELGKILKQKKISSLILMGIFTNDCIKSTAKDAIEKYKLAIITSSDLISKYKSKITKNEWFKKNGLLFETTKELIQAFRESNLEKPPLG